VRSGRQEHAPRRVISITTRFFSGRLLRGLALDYPARHRPRKQLLAMLGRRFEISRNLYCRSSPSEIQSETASTRMRAGVFLFGKGLGKVSVVTLMGSPLGLSCRASAGRHSVTPTPCKEIPDKTVPFLLGLPFLPADCSLRQERLCVSLCRPRLSLSSATRSIGGCPR